MKKQHLLSFALLCACFVPFLAYAQTGVVPYKNAKVQFFNASGGVCSGCKLSTFTAGTTSNLATYSDSLGTVANTNPVVAASDGTMTVYLQTSACYKLQFQTSAGVTLWVQDNVCPDNQGVSYFAEQSAPSCLVNFDLIWGDVAAHRVKGCNNNGSAVQYVLAGVDVNSSDQVTATHLAAPLPVAQGGTGLTAVQGNGTKVQLSTGTTTNGDFVKYDANGNAVDSGLTGVVNKQIFTANGTFTIPANVTAVKVTLIGGGGAGGGASASNTGAGGGSGGYAVKYLSGLTPGNTIAVTVGGGGTGVSNGTGNNGTASTIASGTQTITTVTANGGSGGQAGTTPGPGGGATISTNGDINGAGAPGGFVTAASTFGGAGGSTYLGGAGGFVGGSAVGSAAVANTGSGGGGAGVGATNAGGAGAAGIVIFEWNN